MKRKVRGFLKMLVIMITILALAACGSGNNK
jgi:predicted small lipoprotein YifL